MLLNGLIKSNGPYTVNLHLKGYLTLFNFSGWLGRILARINITLNQ